jgi:hypothetical protein
MVCYRQIPVDGKKLTDNGIRAKIKEYFVKGACENSPQDNREKGGNPLRSRRCKCGAQFNKSLGNWEEKLLR